MIVRENIYEAVQFQRGQDPRKAMGIGIKAQIKNFINEHYEEEDESQWIACIVGDEELDDNTREKWVLFLISEGFNWDYEEWSEMESKGIDYLSALPEGLPYLNMNLRREGDRFFVEFPGWEEWTDCIEVGRDTSDKFIEAVLSGDAFEMFDSDYVPDLGDLAHWIAKHQDEISTLEDIKKKYIELGGDPKDTENIEELIIKIAEDDNFEDLGRAISSAAANTSDLADEAEAYNSITRSIIREFGLKSAEWSGDTFVAEISKEGAKKLFIIEYDGDEKMRYHPPQYGYTGEWDPATFEMELESRLNDLR